MSRITSKTMKRNDNFIAKVTFNHFHGCVEKGKFPNCLKLVNVPQVFKKLRVPEKNYGPNSILSFLPISFEKFLVKQYLELLKAILSKLQCGFRKNLLCSTLSLNDARDFYNKGFEAFKSISLFNS